MTSTSALELQHHSLADFIEATLAKFGEKPAFGKKRGSLPKIMLATTSLKRRRVEKRVSQNNTGEHI